MSDLVTKDDVLAAYKTLKPVVAQTPCQHSSYLSSKYDANIYLKREDLQIVRSFKLRGAYYAIDQLDQAALDRGVICASAGNHAQGVAYTCHKKQVQATIFMPNTTPNQKIDQVKYFGGDYVNIMIQGDTFDACSQAAHDYASQNGLTFVEPFNDRNVIAGQGSLAVEIHQDLVAEGEQADYVMVPVGGGGLVAGVSAYVHEAMPTSQVVAVEPTGASSLVAAHQAGHPVELDHVDHFADGTAVACVGNLNFANTEAYVDDYLSVPEGQIAATILELYTKLAIVAEPSGALSVAGLELMKDQIKGKTVVCVISGGNNDIKRMAEIEEKALMYEGILHYFVVNFPQRAGALREFLNYTLNPDDDITRFEYTKRSNKESGPVLVGVQLGDHQNLPGLLERMAEFDPNYINLQENDTLYQFLV
ncbi:threonine dehydratase [Aerococcus urinaehominis]|uniref:L-threonine dehydratase n=1 Tax=Aerococcus urinaehominis TaxID=128944 RepID=A0A0X8FKK6_9LACT|nr:threonine ammonia-lyase IlvA [Aerococcus urinaehominis]AMB99020.1 threonine dehydratase [Aerococcus urinaehominis]SDM56421.1 L-threonine ammonia-lyase [Aerococcus urinaehominis]